MLHPSGVSCKLLNGNLAPLTEGKEPGEGREAGLLEARLYAYRAIWRLADGTDAAAGSGGAWYPALFM